MIDLRTEKPVSLRAFAQEMKIGYDTVRKWWKRGVLLDRADRSKGKVKLEVIRLTSGHHTSREAYCRFIEAINAAQGVEQPLSARRNGHVNGGGA